VNQQCIWFAHAAHLHTWKQAQVLLDLIFCIGSDSEVLPDHNNWRSRRDGVSPTETPARIVLRALVSTLHVLWFLKKREASLAEIDVFHLLLRNAAVNANLLYRLKQYVVNRPKKPVRGSLVMKHLSPKNLTMGHFYFGGIKFYYMMQLAYYQRMYGLYGSGKDTELTERFHKKVVKQPLESISNVFGGRLVECARHMQKHVHAECLSFKAALSGEIVHPSLPEELDNGSEEELDCSVLKKSKMAAFNKMALCVNGASFHTDKTCKEGFPWLHPFVSLSLLYALMRTHLTRLRTCVGADASLTAELVSLENAMRRNDNRSKSKVHLVDGYKLQSDLRCGDLDVSKGMYYIRSNQLYRDDRRGPVAERLTHAVNSFVFADVEGVIELVRILGIVVCENESKVQPESAVYCVVVVMSPSAWEYLPYHVYQYKLRHVDASTSYPELQIINTNSITAPCFCVSVDPDNFLTVDDLAATTARFYNIPHTWIDPRSESYASYRHESNSEFVDAFRSVEDMNKVNEQLQTEVAKFKITSEDQRALRSEASKITRKDKASKKKKKSRPMTGNGMFDQSDVSAESLDM